MNCKKRIVSFVFLLLATFSIHANVYLRYYNKDSKTHKFEVKIAGSTKTVEFGSSRTSSVTIQGGSEKAEIKTDCGWITLSDDDKIEIKDGCITIK
ncbi:hypothetical protein [Aquimarina algicola]|uniref:Uncharacterized protein n=1 Tax=Aquimarina algicola TaxID=2589995 RepID=A0A504JLA2_9FLAO|nr:hypothetical protein [Aquimarina algicola]TPN87280.1 hypothetical protein FHK87_06750 [Aquimarina algicola]